MTAGKLTGSILFLLGIVLVAGAAVLRFSIAPGLTELSETFNGEATLVGTVSSPNPDPAAGGAMIDTPLEAVTSSTVSSLSDDTGVATFDTNTYLAPRTADSQPISVTSFSYALDRSTFAQADPPEGVSVVDQKGGITINFPPDSDHQNLTYYNAVVQEAQPLNYQGQEEKNGRVLDIYTIDASGPVRNADVLGVLQGGLGQKLGTDGTSAPKLALSALGVPATLLETAPDSIPVSYRQADKSEYWVDPKLGSIVNAIGASTVTTVFELPGQPIPVPASVTTLQTQDSDVAAAISGLNDSDTQLPFFTTWIPLALLVIGVLLLILAMRLLIRSTKKTPNTTASAEPKDLEHLS